MRHPQDPLRAPLPRQIGHPIALQQEGLRWVNDLERGRCQTPTEAERPQAALLLLVLAKEAERVWNTKLGPAATAAAKTVHAGKAEDEAPLRAKTTTAATAATNTSDAAAAAASVAWDQVPIQGEGMHVLLLK